MAERHSKGRHESPKAAGSEASRGAMDAMGTAARSGGEVMRQGWQAGAEAMGQGLQAVDEGQQKLAQSAGSQMQQIGEGMAQAAVIYGRAAHRTAEDFQAIIGATRAATQSWQEAQRTWAEWLSRTTQSGMRLPQEFMQCRSLTDAAEVHSRFMQEAIGDLLEGSTEMLRQTTRLAQDALGPLHERAQQNGRGEEVGQQSQGKVADVMTRDVAVIGPEDTIQEAARRMAKEDTGALPVGDNDRLVGLITDRDIAVRLAAEGKAPGETKVREVMSPEVKYVFEDEDLGHVARNMAELKVRRLPAVNRQKRLVGIVALGDMVMARSRMGAQALRGISEPGGQRAQRAYAGGKPEK